MSLKIQVISDIHLEFIENYKFDEIVKPSAPNLAICGDLGLPYLDSYETFLSKCSENFINVFLISGNHEYYQWKRQDKEIFTMDEVDKEIELIVKKFKNIYFLNNKCHILDDEHVVLGSTLWSNIKPKDYFDVVNSMNDYKQIYFLKNNNKAVITPKFITEKFKENCLWLKNAIEQHSDKKIIIMSHHLPSMKLINDKYKNNSLNCCFVSDLEYLMTDIVYLWLAGHSHSSFDLKIGNTRCLVNPKGYYDENPDYDISLVITV